jgi:mercuric ion transport protein
MQWKQFRGYLAGAVAFVTCPCHLPIIWPILLTLTAGTAFGAWLATNLLIVGAMMTVMFIIGLVLAFRWLLGGQPALCQPDNLNPKRMRLQDEQV